MRLAIVQLLHLIGVDQAGRDNSIPLRFIESQSLHAGTLHEHSYDPLILRPSRVRRTTRGQGGERLRRYKGFTIRLMNANGRGQLHVVHVNNSGDELHHGKLIVYQKYCSVVIYGSRSRAT